MKPLDIHDIKSLETIPDYSLWMVIALGLIAIFIISSLIYYLIQYFKNKNCSKKVAYNTLKNLDLNQSGHNSKEYAYIITKLACKIIENPREKKLYEELIENLEQYKYKKTVEPFNAQSQHLFKLFMDAVDVK